MAWAMSARRTVRASHRHVLDPRVKPGSSRLVAAAAARLHVRDPSCLAHAKLAQMPARGHALHERNPARGGPPTHVSSGPMA